MERFKKNDQVKISDKNHIWSNKFAIVLDDSNPDDIEDDIDYTEVKVKITLNVGDSEKTLIQTFPRYRLKLVKIDETINEEYSIKNDFIKEYVTIEDIDGKRISSWFFTAKLAIAENVDEKIVIETAKKFKYKLYLVQGYNFNRIIVANPKCDIQTIMNDYVNYISGGATLKEI